MKNEFDIKQVVYSLISELRYLNKEQYLKLQIELSKSPNYNATTINSEFAIYETKERKLFYLQEEFERWVRENK